MTDHAFDLLIAMEAALPALDGSWHSNPMPGGQYPYGTFYITSSKRQAGNAYRHNGIVNIWCRGESDISAQAVAAECYNLSAQALIALDGGFPVTGFALHDFRADDPRRELQADGTWRGFFTFTAMTTKEAAHG